MKSAGEGSLLDRLPEEIGGELPAEPAFRSRQIFQWIHSRDLRSFDAMSNLPKSLRDRLERDYHLDETVIDHIDRSPDGTVKLRLLLADGEMIEAVLLTDAGLSGGGHRLVGGVIRNASSRRPSPRVALIRWPIAAASRESASTASRPWRFERR